METPAIIAGRRQGAYYWHVGDHLLTAYPTASGWEARLRSRGWGEAELVLDEHFGSEADAVAWCCRMADVLAQDQAEEG